MKITTESQRSKGDMEIEGDKGTGLE